MIDAKVTQGGRFFNRKVHLIIGNRRVFTTDKSNVKALEMSVSSARAMRAELASAALPLLETLKGNPEIINEIKELFQ